jgi:4-hydroxy-tetrahydrodipicolinate synthase
MQQAARAGNLSAARSLQDRLLPLISALGPEGDAVRIKHALRLMRSLESELRLPLVAAEPEMRFAIGKALAPFLDESCAEMALSL